MASASDVGTYASLGYAASGITYTAETATLFVPWLTVITFAFDILELAGVMPNPITLLISLFIGRPREEASLQQAHRLLTARNPAARLLGMQIERMVNEWGIVTSEGGPGRAILNAATEQFAGNLVAQGVDLTRARHILTQAFSRDAQSGLPLEPELQAPLDPQLGFNAPSDVSNAFMAQYTKAVSSGLTIDKALNNAEQWLFKHEGLSRLFKLQIGKFIPTDPPQPKVIPGRGGTCPDGYTLDPVTEFCLLNPTTGPGGPPPPPLPPGGQPDPYGDEITNDLCAQMGANTQALINALGCLSQPAPVDPACCTNLVDAISNVVTSLGSIASALANIGGGTPVDLSGVVGALDHLVAAVGKLPAAAPIDLSGITDQLARIATSLETEGPTDIKPLVDAINNFAKIMDVKPATADALVAGGFIDAEVAQAIPRADLGDWLTATLGTHTSEMIRGFIIGAIGYDIKTKATLLPGAGNITKLITSAAGTYLKATDRTLEPVITPILNLIKAQIAPATTPPVGSAGIPIDTAVQSAVSVEFSAMLAAAVLSYLGWDIAEPATRIMEIVAAGIGYEELKDVQIGPLVRHGIHQVAEMNAKKLFQQELPGNGEVMNWVARGLLDPARADELEALNGLHFSLRGPAQAAHYHGLQPRQLIRAFESGLFTSGDIADELTFNGMRPASQKRMLLLAPWLATNSERNQLRGTLEKAYVEGLLADADLHQQLDQMEQNVDRQALILQRVQIEQRILFAKELESAYRQEFIAQITAADQYRSKLAGIGLTDAWINVRLALDEAHLTAVLKRSADAAERALIRATVAEERKAAMKNFTTGHIGLPALVAALVLTGLTPTQAAAWADLAALEKGGGLRWIYGLQRPPDQAALLKSRVAALSDQRKRLQISDAQLVAALTALGIPASYVNSIRAGVDAMVTPKAAAVTIPVETA
jgi:hypothetical protein